MYKSAMICWQNKCQSASHNLTCYQRSRSVRFCQISRSVTLSSLGIMKSAAEMPIATDAPPPFLYSPEIEPPGFQAPPPYHSRPWLVRIKSFWQPYRRSCRSCGRCTYQRCLQPQLVLWPSLIAVGLVAIIFGIFFGTVYPTVLARENYESTTCISLDLSYVSSRCCSVQDCSCSVVRLVAALAVYQSAQDPDQVDIVRSCVLHAIAIAVSVSIIKLAVSNAVSVRLSICSILSKPRVFSYTIRPWTVVSTTTRVCSAPSNNSARIKRGPAGTTLVIFHRFDSMAFPNTTRAIWRPLASFVFFSYSSW